MDASTPQRLAPSGRSILTAHTDGLYASWTGRRPGVRYERLADTCAALTSPPRETEPLHGPRRRMPTLPLGGYTRPPHSPQSLADKPSPWVQQRDRDYGLYPSSGDRRTVKEAKEDGEKEQRAFDRIFPGSGQPDERIERKLLSDLRAQGAKQRRDTMVR